MTLITGKHLPRRTFLHGVGVSVALPFLDAFVPAGLGRARTSAARFADPTRLVCVENVHGAAGSTAYGASCHLWSPADVGRDFDLTPSALSPMAPFRDALTIVSDTDVAPAEAVTPPDRGRSLPLQRHVPDAVASEADRELRRAGRDLAGPALRATLRPGHADSLDAALHRERGPSRRLRLRLLVRLHRYHQLGVADRAAADDPGSTPGVRAAVRRRRHGRPAHRAAPGAAERARLHHRRGGHSPALPRPCGPAADGSLPGRRPRDRAADPTGGGAQHQRGGAAAAGRTGGRARLVRRAREADVRPAGAGLRGGHDARLLVQAVARRHRPRLPGERRRPRVPLFVPPRRAGDPDRGVRADQPLPREPDPLLPREAAEHRGGQRQPARQGADHLWVADGQSERAQPQAVPVVRGRGRQREAARQPAPAGRARHADGQRHAGPAPPPRRRRHRALRRQPG